MPTLFNPLMVLGLMGSVNTKTGPTISSSEARFIENSSQPVIPMCVAFSQADVSYQLLPRMVGLLTDTAVVPLGLMELRDFQKWVINL